MAGSASGLARRTRDLVEEMPADREHALVHVALVEGGKEGGGHVEGAGDAAGARVDHSGVLPDALLLVQNGDLLATVRLFIVHVLRERDDEVFRSAVPATSAQTRRKESGVAAEARGSASPYEMRSGVRMRTVTHVKWRFCISTGTRLPTGRAWALMAKVSARSAVAKRASLWKRANMARVGRKEENGV